MYPFFCLLVHVCVYHCPPKTYGFPQRRQFLQIPGGFQRGVDGCLSQHGSHGQLSAANDRHSKCIHIIYHQHHHNHHHHHHHHHHECHCEKCCSQCGFHVAPQVVPISAERSKKVNSRSHDFPARAITQILVVAGYVLQLHNVLTFKVTLSKGNHSNMDFSNSFLT